MGSATNKQRRRKELEKHVATQAANKKMLSDSLARRDKKLEKQDRVLNMAQPSPGTTKVSGEAAEKKKLSLGERMVITGMAGVNQHARNLQRMGVLKIQESDKTGLVLMKDNPANQPSKKQSNPLKKALKK